MFNPDLRYENALRFSRFDSTHVLSTCSPHPIVLEDKNWLTCEHYLQAKLVQSASMSAQIEAAPTGSEAYELGKPWYRRRIENWKKVRVVLMTRAIYTKVQMYDEVRRFLIDTDDILLANSSQYEYFWGIGRDTRGENQLGKVWMDVRSKLLAEASDASSESSSALPHSNEGTVSLGG